MKISTWSERLTPAVCRNAGRYLAGAVAALALICSGCNHPAAVSAASSPQPEAPAALDTVKVVSRQLNLNVPLPGELEPYQEVRVFPKVTGFVKWIGVDRGSRVRKGELLATLEAPELVSQRAGAESSLQSAENRVIEAQAKLSADESMLQRLQVAARTPGVVSDEELEEAQKSVEADRARVVALKNTRDAARSTLHALEETESYLRITAPFDGVVTKRNVHPGALIGPSGGPGSQSSMMRIEEVSHLRLVVAVPEAFVGGVLPGASVKFTVPAFPGRTFSGTVARSAESMDPATRTMPVEMDVWNPTWELHSGMFPEVSWPVRRHGPTLFVPQSAVGRNMEQTYVMAISGGRTVRVTVRTGASSGQWAEVFGDLRAGDEVVLRASDDLRPETEVSPHLVDVPQH